MNQISDLLTKQTPFEVDNCYLEIGDIDVKKHDYSLNKNKAIVTGAVKAQKGTILISTVRPTRGAIVILRESIYVSSAFCQIYIEDENLRMFMFQYFLLPSFTKYMADNCEGGTYPTIKDETILKHHIELPLRAVIDFDSKLLKNFDAFILEKKNEVSFQKKYKATMLYKMFPQEGKLVPEIRFKGFEGEWKGRSLNECISYLNDAGCDRKCNFISTENMLQNFSGINRYDTNQTVKGILFKTNDILMSNIRPYLKKLWLSSIDGVCSTDIIAMRTKSDFYAKFIYFLLANDSFISYVMSATKGTKMPRGDKQHILEYKLFCPNINEQRKIANFFGNLDSMIENQEKEIETLEHFKATMLSKMFA